MSAHCCEHESASPETIVNLPRYRRILWIALCLNATMFLLELAAGFRSGSTSLLADAIDFGGDALNYGVSLAVLTAELSWRARAALLKAISMMGFGLFVLGRSVWGVFSGAVPDASTMGLIGFLALAVNVGVAWMLYAFREGDANMRSVWLCSRNDAIGNLAVLGAALGVWGSASAWPDLIVASLMASLAISSGWQVFRQARREISEGSVKPHPHG